MPRSCGPARRRELRVRVVNARPHTHHRILFRAFRGFLVRQIGATSTVQLVMDDTHSAGRGMAHVSPPAALVTCIGPRPAENAARERRYRAPARPDRGEPTAPGASRDMAYRALLDW